MRRVPSVHAALLVTCLALLTPWLSAMAAEPEPKSTAISGPATNSVTELGRIELQETAAQQDTDRWLEENNRLRALGAGLSDSDLEIRVTNRFEPVRKQYQAYVQDHPKDPQGHLLYGNFLNQRQDESGAQREWESALALDPTNAVLYNNLAGRYAETGPAEKVFQYFEKAIALGPGEPDYYHNFGDGLYVLRTQAGRYYHLDEQQVYFKVLLMYSNALSLDPKNYAFARDLAQTYYSLKPLPFDQALSVWTNAWKVATNSLDREDAQIHLARVKMLAGRLVEAREQLAGVTNQTWLKTRDALLHNIAEREK